MGAAKMAVPSSKAKNLKIVLVEDDLQLLESWKDLFELTDHRLVCYPRALEAIADPAELSTCDLLISDYYLPDLNGITLIEKARVLNPGLQAILLTGSRDKGIAEAVERLEGCSILYKPVNIEDVEERIQSLFGG